MKLSAVALFPEGRRSGWICMLDLVQILHRMLFLLQSLLLGMMLEALCDPALFPSLNPSPSHLRL